MAFVNDVLPRKIVDWSAPSSLKTKDLSLQALDTAVWQVPEATPGWCVIVTAAQTTSSWPIRTGFINAAGLGLSNSKARVTKRR